MFIQTLALRGKGNSTVSTDEQLTVQFTLQDIHAAGNVGLIIIQDFCCFGKAFVLADKIENAVIIKVDQDSRLLLAAPVCGSHSFYHHFAGF